MATRIAGINLPDEKRAEIALTYIYGIGRSASKKLLQEFNIDLNIKLKDIPESIINTLREKIEKKMIVEGDLRRTKAQDIKRLKEINSYRGNRHKANLPVRGQKTKTNARTKRGKKTTIGSGKVKLVKK